MQIINLFEPFEFAKCLDTVPVQLRNASKDNVFERLCTSFQAILIYKILNDDVAFSLIRIALVCVKIIIIVN